MAQEGYRYGYTTHLVSTRVGKLRSLITGNQGDKDSMSSSEGLGKSNLS